MRPLPRGDLSILDSTSYLFFCLTSKMSHDHSRHDSCRLRLYSRWIHSIVLSLARGMTDVGVGSGALLGLFVIVDLVRMLRFARDPPFRPRRSQLARHQLYPVSSRS